MSRETLSQAIDLMASADRNHFNIIFHGGEPLLAGYAWYAYALPLIRRHFGNRARLNLQSNLWALDERFIRLFTEYGVTFSTSLDGPKHINDALRGEGYFDRTFAGIRLLQEYGLSTGIIATVTSHTIDKLWEINDFFVSHGLSYTFHAAVAPMADVPNAYALDEAQQARLALTSMEIAARHTDTMRLRDAAGIVKGVYAGKGCGICTYDNCLGQYAAMDADGSIYGCQRFCGLQEYSFGKLSDHPKIASLEQSEGYRRLAALQKQAYTEGGCGGCSHFPYCNNGCLYSLAVHQAHHTKMPGRPGCHLEAMFDEVTMRLAEDAGNALLENGKPRPYLVMAGAERDPVPGHRVRQRIRAASLWGLTKAPEFAFQRKRGNRLYINITGRCPLHCPHCCADAGPLRDDHMHTDMLFALIRKAVRGGWKELIFTGGEPALHPDFHGIMAFLQGIPHLDTRFTLRTTLCFDCEGNFLADLFSTFDSVGISLDGDAPAHDALRGDGVFAATMAKLLRAKEMGVSQKLFVESVAQGKDRDAVKRIANELKIGKVKFRRILPLGRGASCADHEPLPAPGLEEYLRHPTVCDNCGLGANMHVEPSGDAYPCFALVEPEYRLGNVSEGLDTLLYGEKMDALRAYGVDKNEFCKTCGVRYLCGGICKAECTAIEGNRLETMRFSCSERQSALRRIAESIGARSSG